MAEKFCVGCEEPVIDKKPPCPLQCKSDKCKAYQTKIAFHTDTTPIVCILGGPGSGKLTQCERIIAKYGFAHISVGDLMRAEVMKGSARAKCLSSVMDRGGLVSNDITLEILKEGMEAAAPNARGFLVDGYPREKSQGAALEQSIGRVALVLYFEASDKTLIARLISRAESSGRSDDNENTVKLRLETFHKHNDAVIESFGDRVCRINAEQTPEAIFIEVQKVMDPIVARAQAATAKLAKDKTQKTEAVAAQAREATGAEKAKITENIEAAKPIP